MNDALKEDAKRIKELEKELALWKKDTIKLVFELKALFAETGWKSTAVLLDWWDERNRT
jgi:hypothetical protein